MSHTPPVVDLELVSDEVRVHIHRKPACRIQMEVLAAPGILAKARKQAVKSVGKEISLPGFRKGRAPEEMILKKFPNDVEKQTQKEAADLAFAAAQKIAQVPVLNRNSPVSFEMKNRTAEGAAELIFTFETEPQVPAVDPSQFTPQPVAKAEVGEKQVEEAIRQMRFFYAAWTPVEDRPIQDGDYIMIDLDTVEGELTQRVFHHIRFEVSKERMAAWMKKLVEGARAGDVLEGVSEPDQDAPEAEKQEFKPKNVRITILKAEQCTLPEIDDHFAQKVGAEDVGHMRQSIADLLNKQADDKVQNELREQVNEYLIATYAFDLPQSLIDTERNHRLGQMLRDPKMKKEWDQMSQEERKKVADRLNQESKDAVSLFYLSRQIVQAAKIPVTHQEVQNEAISMYRSHGGGQSQTDQLPQEIYALALSKVILSKAQDFVLKKT